MLSLVLSLAILEWGLRIAGYYYSKKVISVTTFDNPGRDLEILSIGDSYTVGGAGIWKDSYPIQLQEILSQNSNKKFNVINGGVCESNSTQALRHLSELIGLKKPDYVLLLVGAANRFNFSGSNLQGKIKEIIYNLRIYKMFRILRTNLKGELLKRESIRSAVTDADELAFNWRFSEEESQGLRGTEEMYREEQRRLRTAEKMYQKIIELNPDQHGIYALGEFYEKQGRQKEAEETYRKIIELNPVLDDAYLLVGAFYGRQGRWEEAAKMYLKAVELNPGASNAYFKLGRYYEEQRRFEESEGMYRTAIKLNPGQGKGYLRLGGLQMHRGKFADAVESMCRGVELNPENLLEPDYFYSLVQAYELQSKYDSDYILEVFQKAIENKPEIKRNENVIRYISFFKNKENWEQGINQWLKRDLEKIVELCRKNDVGLIIQNYPYPYSSTNKILKDVALRYSLPFVDNHSVFEKSVAAYGRWKYFVDNDHCTAEGHKVMAQNVYKVLVSEGIVSENESGVEKDEKVAF